MSIQTQNICIHRRKLCFIGSHLHLPIQSITIIIISKSGLIGTAGAAQLRGGAPQPSRGRGREAGRRV